MVNRAGHRAGGGKRPSARQRGFASSWMVPVVLTLAFVLILGSLLYLVRSQRLTDHEQDLSVTLTNIQLKLQHRLNANREFLGLLGAEIARGDMDMDLIRRRADAFVSRRDELAAIRWADGDLVVRWSAPPIIYRGLLDLQVRLPSSKRAARVARETRQPHYTRHYVPLQGDSTLEVYVPVFDGERFLGLFIGTYSTDDLLLYGGTPEVFEHYRLCHVDAAGDLVGECIAWEEVDPRLRRVAELHPEIEDLFLSVTRYKNSWGWGLKLLVLLSIVLVIGMGWGGWTMNRVIARRRKVEKALRESEEKYRLLFSAESDAILVFDGETSAVVEANDAAVALYGWSREELLNLTARDLTTRPHLAQKRIEEVLEGQLERIPLDFQKKKDGSVFPAEISTGTFSWKGRPMFVGLVRDITERRRGEQLKDEMLSAVSHEMRTPLTAILGFSEYLLGNDVDARECKEYLKVIHRESDRLESLINNLLNLQRLRAGFGINEFVEVDLPDLFREVAEGFSASDEKDRIEFDCPDDLDPVVADRELLFQAIQNLLSNALKYSGEGTVTLGGRDREDSVVLWVADCGPGIPEPVQGQIFDRFFRIDTRDGRRVGGSGLGLPLVKEIARAHEGDVDLKSEPGVGSTFFIRLPRQLACPLQ